MAQPSAAPLNGATAKLYPASATFAHDPPQLNDAFPVAGLISSTTTGPSAGSDGAYRFTGIATGEYYVGIQYGSQIAWDYHQVP